MRKRIEWIDVCKGIAILLVIIGHSGLSTGMALGIKKIIYSFHMPLFFILSGFLFSNRSINFSDFSSFFYKKMKSLIIPYFVFNIMFLLFKFFKSILINKAFNFINLFVGIIIPIRNFDNVGMCWFLIWIFVTEILYFLLVTILKKDHLISIVSILFYYVGFLLIKNNVALPFHIDAAFISIIFYNIGYLLNKYDSKINYKKVIMFVCLLFIIVFTINNSILGKMYGNDVMLDIYGMNLSYPIVYFLVAISGSFIIIYVSKFLKIDFLKKKLVKLGYNSLCIYGFHTLVISVLTKMLVFFNITSGRTIIEIIRSIIIAVFCFGLLPLCSYLEKKLPFLFGYKVMKYEKKK